MKRGIVCLPVYDSFIVASQFEEELKTAMLEAFKDEMGGEASLADFEKLEADDPLPVGTFKIDYANGGVTDYSTIVYPTDFTYLRNKALKSFSATYLSTFFQQFTD